MGGGASKAKKAPPEPALKPAKAEPAKPAVEEDEDFALPEPPKLTKDKLTLVKQLYDALHAIVGVEGGLSVFTLQESSAVQVGPYSTLPLAGEALEADANGDGMISLEELQAFFRKGAAVLSDDEFETTLKEMIAQAPQKIAEEEASMWKEPEAMPLSEARLALVNALYDAFKTTLGDTPDGIEVEKLQSMAICTTGPIQTRPLTSDKILEMDADSDGKVTQTELIAYFTQDGMALSDDEFSLLLNDITSSVLTPPAPPALPAAEPPAEPEAPPAEPEAPPAEPAAEEPPAPPAE